MHKDFNALGNDIAKPVVPVVSRDTTRGVVRKRPGLLLDSRVVDVPMLYNPIVVTLSSLKPFFFNGLK